MDVKINLLEVNKISLNPGDVLLAKVGGKDFEDDAVCDALAQSLRSVFPNNKVGVLFLNGNSIDLSVISQETAQALEKASNGESEVPKESACNTTNYCDNCNCGKKERLTATEPSLISEAQEPITDLPKEE